jgi:acetyl/propionyl-CoA carboxylase alpha subunit
VVRRIVEERLMPTIQLKSGAGEAIAVELRRDAGGHFTGRVDEQQVEGRFQELADGQWILRIGHHVMPCHCIRRDARIEVWLGGETYVFEMARPKGRGSHTEAGGVAEEILAPMPGTVLRINVKPGDRFEAHQPLIIMESMKMEITLSAPHAGRVSEIRCRVGELVAMGSVLAKLEGSTSDAESPPPGKDR